MNIFLSLFIIFSAGILGGFIFEKIKLPKLIFYIILGILIVPSVFNIVDRLYKKLLKIYNDIYSFILIKIML